MGIIDTVYYFECYNDLRSTYFSNNNMLLVCTHYKRISYYKMSLPHVNILKTIKKKIAAVK